MVQPAMLPAEWAATSRPHFLPEGLPAAGGVLVVASESIIAEVLAVALSTCGVSARQAVALPWFRSPPRRGMGPAIVVLGPGESDTAMPRTVAVLVGAGHRVAVIAAAEGNPALSDCMDAGAEAVVRNPSSLNELATLMHELSQEGPVRSPVDLDGLRTRQQALGGGRELLLRRLAGLTNRESEILAGLMAGRRAAAIARNGFVSLHTVRTQIRSMLGKLEVHSQVEAVALAYRAGWVPGSER